MKQRVVGTYRLDRAHCSLSSEGLDDERQIEDRVHANALVAAPQALDVVLQTAFEQIVDEIAIRGCGERAFQSIEEHTSQLRHVVLLKSIAARPAKRRRQRSGRNGTFLRQLQLPEQRLQLVGNAVRWDIVHGSVVLPDEQHPSEFRSHEQCLQQAIHVTCCALVCEPRVAGSMLARGHYNRALCGI